VTPVRVPVFAVLVAVLALPAAVPAAAADRLSAEEAHKRDLEALHEAGDRAADPEADLQGREADALGGIGADARRRIEDARRAGDLRAEAEAWRELGTALLFLGRDDDAVQAMETSAALYRDAGQPHEVERVESMLRLIRPPAD
jgi:hypothetical protein